MSVARGPEGHADDEEAQALAGNRPRHRRGGLTTTATTEKPTPSSSAAARELGEPLGGVRPPHSGGLPAARRVDVRRRPDQADVAEGLREVAELLLGPGVDLLGEQPEVVGVVAELPEEGLGRPPLFTRDSAPSNGGLAALDDS
jgi:hypothetical protein